VIGGHWDPLRRQLERELPEAIKLRQQLHQQPDLSSHEGPTRDIVLRALPHGAGARQVATTGAIIRIGGPGPAVAVRAELDALPITEATGVPWASQRPGVMHACGHDIHLAAIVALARAVDAVGGPAPLLAVLQPREETYPSGARDIIRSGFLHEEAAVATIAAHVQPLLGAGTVSCTVGAVNASNDEFTITIKGRGGHAAYPHQTIDPVVALAHVVIALQTLVSRGVDPMAPVTLSITTLSAGTAPNVIPDLTTAHGTIRALDDATRHDVVRKLTEVVDLTARANGCIGSVAVTHGEPVLNNHAGIAHATVPLLRGMGVEVDEALRSLGSDDFSYFSEGMPSLMMFVGTGAGGGDERLHSATFAPADERIGHVAKALLAGYVAAAELSTHQRLTPRR